MSRCHNCGRETLRTLDWACQWCGYPIVSGGYGKIEKTYRQLKEERLWGERAEPMAEYEPEPEMEQEEEEKIKVSEPEEELGVEERMAEEIEVVAETESEPEPEPEPKAEPEIKQEVEAEECVVEEAEVEELKEVDTLVEVIASEEKEELPVTEVAPETEAEPEIEVEQEPELEEAAEELNVAEMFKAYEEDDVAADERFAGKVLKITGVVSLIDVKNVSANHYIRLSTSEGDLMQSVQCIFDKRYAAELSHLERGQEVMVQGRYNGSVIAMRIVDCVLIT